MGTMFVCLSDFRPEEEAHEVDVANEWFRPVMEHPLDSPKEIGMDLKKIAELPKRLLERSKEEMATLLEEWRTFISSSKTS